MTEAEKQLLTAYLDGVVTPAEKERAENLLRTSAEARQFFSALVSDSLRLKYLRREQLSADFAEFVVRLVRQEAVRIMWRARLRRWVPLAVAATLLPFIAWGTFVLLSQLLTRPPSPLNLASPEPNRGPQAVAQSSAPQSRPATDTERSWVQLVQSWRQAWQDSLKAQERWQRSLSTLLEPLGELASAAWSEVEPLVLGDWNPAVPGIGEPSVLTSPVRYTDRNPFRTLEVRLPPIFPWEQFDRGRVQEILAQGRFLVLDVSCRDGQRTWERIHQSLRHQKIPVVLDNRLKTLWDRRQSTVYFVYVENLTAAQASDWLLALHREDTRLTGKRPPEVQIRSILVRPILPEERQRLGELLGLPTGSLPEIAATPPQVSGEALSEDTLRKLEQIASGQAIRPGLAQAVAFCPLRYPPSKDIQRFRREHGQVRSDAYHFLLIFRPER